MILSMILSVTIYLSYEFTQMLILFLYHGESSVDTRAFPSAPPVIQVPD